MEAAAAVEVLPGRALVAEGHALELVKEAAPVVRQHLRVLDALLRPVLVPPADVVLRLLEVDQLVPHALLDEHRPVVLCHDRFFVLLQES